MEHTGRRNKYKVSKSFLLVMTSSKTPENTYLEKRRSCNKIQETSH